MGSRREARAVLAAVQVSDPGPPSVLGRSRSSTTFHSRLPRVSSSATILRARPVLLPSQEQDYALIRWDVSRKSPSPDHVLRSGCALAPDMARWCTLRSGGGVLKIPLPNIHPPATVARQIGFREQRWREYRAGLHGRRGVQESPGFPGVGRRGAVPRDQFLTTSRPLAGERRTGSDVRGCPGAWFDPRGGSVQPTEFVRVL